MAGRASKPTAMILTEKKSHRTKAEIETRQKSEKALYTGVHFAESQQVADNQIAHTEFIRLNSLYDKIAYVDALDQNIINRYCLEVAQLYDLQSHVARLHLDLDMVEAAEDRMKIYDMIIKTYASMDKSKAILLKYEDRLFLTPAGRMRAIPKTPPQEESESGFAAFFKGRADAE